jgi:tRNA A37 methylthiotransferase MiaB
LGENDILIIKEGLGDVKASLGELTKAVADLRVLVAGCYVTKEEFNKHLETDEARVDALYKRINSHERTEQATRWKMFSAAMTVAAFVFGIIQWVFNIAKNKGVG